jgi:hypothetical protein
VVAVPRILDGPAETGIVEPNFKLLIRDRRYGSARLYAFHLLELDGVGRTSDRQVGTGQSRQLSF